MVAVKLRSKYLTLKHFQGGLQVELVQTVRLSRLV
jgi:hypothetical protein